MNTYSPNTSELPHSNFPFQLPNIGYQALDFTPDFVGGLGDGFGAATIELGPDPDGETPISFTLIRYAPNGETKDLLSRPAIFFVHGMTDYFFHDHVAKKLHDEGFAVYGVDLRKCGRSWQKGQTWHHVTDQSMYDLELTTTLSLLSEVHPHVFAVGHSTGGLDVATWSIRFNEWAKADGQGPITTLHEKLSGIILNSPWIGLQFDLPTKLAVRYAIPQIAKIAPNIPLPGGINPNYGKTLHTSESGRWDYNLELKPLLPRKKYVSWMTGIVRQITELQSRLYNNDKPTLMLCSDTHNFSSKLTPDSYRADLILRPEDMRRWVGHISPGADVVTIEGAMHDVFLSEPRPLTAAFEATEHWLNQQLENLKG